MESMYTAAEASRLAGFEKPWMLVHLEREAIFCRAHAGDKRQGRARKYTFTDVVILRSINRLLELGARPARIKKILSGLGQTKGLDGTRKQVEALSRSLGTRLFVSDQQAFIVDDDKTIMDLLSSGQLAFGFMVDFSNCVRPVADVISKYDTQRKKLWKQNQTILEKLCAEAGI
jgi:DNA-binding transcriptional MerR regulator